MIVKRKKNSRQRGTHTHGWGSKKKHRGAGNRGGRGNAGSGKRGDAKKPSFWKDTSYGNKKGFTSLKKTLKTININQLEKLKKTTINLREEGYDKLLGTGNTDTKYDLKVNQASKSAVKKIEKAGGKVTLLQTEKTPEKKNSQSSEPKKELPKEEPLNETEAEDKSEASSESETEE